MESNHPADPPCPTHTGDASAFGILIKRNCSMSPRSVLGLLVVTAAVCFSIGALFAWRGLWFVLPFAGLEVAALALAFYVSGLHAGDYERYWLEKGCLIIEVRDGAKVSSHRFHAAWARVVLRETVRATQVALAEGRAELRVGRHLTASGRAVLARQLREVLRAAAAVG